MMKMTKYAMTCIVCSTFQHTSACWIPTRSVFLMVCPKVVSNLGKHKKRNLKFFLKRAHLDYGISCWHMQKSRLYIRNFCYCHIHLMSKCPSRLCNTSGFVVVEKCDKATVSGRHLPEMNTIFGWLGINGFFLREFNLDLDLNLFVQMLPFHPRPVVPSENSLKSSKSKWKLDVQCTLYTHLRTMYLRTRILMKTGFWTSWLSKYRPESEKIFEACLGVSLLLCEPLQQILHLRFQDVFN